MTIQDEIKNAVLLRLSLTRMQGRPRLQSSCSTLEARFVKQVRSRVRRPETLPNLTGWILRNSGGFQ